MTCCPQENFHAFQDLGFQVLPYHILAWETTVTGRELEWLERSPNPMDFLWWKGYHIRIRPHEGVRCGAR